MTFFRNHKFIGGIALGGVCGIIIGSVIAFTIGESKVDALRRLINQRVADKRGLEYKYLY